MATEEIKIQDLVAGNWEVKLLKVLLKAISDDSKQEVQKELLEGKELKELHTKPGRRKDAGDYNKREFIVGQMKLPKNGNWLCYAIWRNKGKLTQTTFKITIDPDAGKTVLSLAMASPPNDPATTYTVEDFWFKFDTDFGGGGPQLSIAGELGVSYHEPDGTIRTFKFTTQPNNVLKLNVG